MTKIFLLGTFHFMESQIDFYSSDVQNELAILAQGLLQFQPDAIAVEAAAHAQKDIDASYQNFSLSDLQSREKMQSKALGDIHLYGGTYPITYNNEAVQIGYRLGKLSAHNRVYAIDDDTALDMSAMNHPTPSLTAALHTLRDVDQPGNSLLERYRICNSEAWSKANHAVYVQANAIRTQENAYAGAEMVAKWYERNLKIFANIQHLAANHERLLILFGAGHLEILKSLINADCNLQLVDSSEYLSL